MLPYKSGRGHGWVKVKCSGREELVVLGWTPPGGSRKGIGALHVGYYDPEGRLHYAGGVGSGYSEKELATLRKRLDNLKPTLHMLCSCRATPSTQPSPGSSRSW